MRTLPSFGVMICVAALAAAPVLAQQTPPVSGTPAPDSNLTVASVKLDSGWRASKLIGAAVYNDQNQQVGSVDDLVVTGADKITTVIISVGGFLGIGSKLVAVPYPQLKVGADLKVMLPGASKDSLNGMPNFTWAG